MSFTLQVENLRALRRVEWTPEGVCALVGANGSGKSTLLQVLRFLNLAVARGVEEAFRLTFVSSYQLRSWDAQDGANIFVRCGLDGAKWGMELVPRSATVVLPVYEFVQDAEGAAAYHRERGSGAATDLMINLPGSEKGSAEKILSDMFKHLFGRLHVYHDPDLWSLRTQGSSTADARLHSRGQNAFAVLRTWHERREHRHRYRFVLEGLQAAFPSGCGDIDFESAGPSTFVRLWPPGSEEPSSIVNEANGVLAMLVYLCDIASGEPGGLVAIDEPENSLHPHAIRELLAGAHAWSSEHDITIVLATHSPVILNELSSNPERVWVMRTDAGDEPNPIRLDHLKNPDWLRNFALGTLYANGELGSNDDAA